MQTPITIARTDGVSIGELARRTGVHIETIRYYERAGLLPRPKRSANGRRVFGVEDMKRLIFICRSRSLGFSQREIRMLLSLAHGGAKSCGEVQALATAHLQDIRSKIEDLKRMEDALAATVRQCAEGGTPACPVLDALGGA